MTSHGGVSGAILGRSRAAFCSIVLGSSHWVSGVYIGVWLPCSIAARCDSKIRLIRSLISLGASLICSRSIGRGNWTCTAEECI